jgi:hypothetical protein
MITIRDVAHIETSAEQVLEWLAHFQENYLAWHPDHTACRYLKGTSLLEEGAVITIEEILHGDRHRLKLRTTKVIPDRRVEYRGSFGYGGAFEVRPVGDEAEFIAELYFGIEHPVLGALLDGLLERLLSRQIEGIRRHVAEEGENLKRLLEGQHVT